MTYLHHSAPPLWWTQTTFGTIILVMFFLTWGLILVNMALLTLWFVRRLFGGRGDEGGNGKSASKAVKERST